MHKGNWKTLKSSKGCPVTKDDMREIVAKSEDKTLKVVPFVTEDITWDKGIW